MRLLRILRAMRDARRQIAELDRLNAKYDGRWNVMTLGDRQAYSPAAEFREWGALGLLREIVGMPEPGEQEDA